jgi:predicted nucleotidyltransferase
MGIIVPETSMNGPFVESSLARALFGATRQAVLSLLFGHPDQRFYQRQIIQRIGLGSGTVQRELQNLVLGGVLVRTVEGRQTYFQVNRQSPIFGELQSIVRKTLGVSQVLREALSKLGRRIKVAFVYGSIATGKETSVSDIDVLIIGGVSLMDVVSATANSQRDLGREVNPSIYPVAEFCRKLAAGQHFITSVVESPKIFLIGNEQQLKRLVEKRVAQGTQHKPSRNSRPSRRRRS